ncbi:MAG: peptidoglycan DD-metalloendopeptidase family protein [Leptonema sp. (in: bacteria)]
MQYHKRFQQKPEVKKFELRGKFSIIHLGNGSFIYTIPGKDRPKIKRIDFFDFNLKKFGLGFLSAFVLFIVFFIFNTKSGIATSQREEQQKNHFQETFKNLSPYEIEKQSEELKNKLLNLDKEIESKLNNKEKYITYEIKEGDSLNSIAGKFRIPVKFILQENQIEINTILKPGQTLKIPNKPGIFYTIRKGDRLSFIAEKYQVSLEDIIKDNDHLENYDILKVGKKIFLANAIIPEPPPIWKMPAYGKITSFFGYRNHPLYGYRQFHGGIDIALNFQRVTAARDGIVYFAGFMGGYGLAVIIKHDSKFKTLYAHLSKIFVKEGQIVRTGTPIGISGNTGFSTGPHLHFEIIYNGIPVNPFVYIKK